MYSSTMDSEGKTKFPSIPVIPIKPIKFFCLPRQEDLLLLSLIDVHGPTSWSIISSCLTGRTSKQCSERSVSYYTNLLHILTHLFPNDRYKHYLSPNVVQDTWTREEDLAILTGQSVIGNKWTEM